jgi:hypothetical protein
VCLKNSLALTLNHPVIDDLSFRSADESVSVFFLAKYVRCNKNDLGYVTQTFLWWTPGRFYLFILEKGPYLKYKLIIIQCCYFSGLYTLSWMIPVFPYTKKTQQKVLGFSDSDILWGWGIYQGRVRGNYNFPLQLSTTFK